MLLKEKKSVEFLICLILRMPACWEKFLTALITGSSLKSDNMGWSILRVYNFLKMILEFFNCIVFFCYKFVSISKGSLREKCPNTEFFLVRTFPHSDWTQRDRSISPYSVRMRENTGQKTVRICTPFTQ